MKDLKTPLLVSLVLLISAPFFLGTGCQDSLNMSELPPPDTVPRKPNNADIFYFTSEIDGDSLNYRDLYNSNITNGAETEYLSASLCTGQANIARADHFYFGDFSDTGATNIIQVQFWGCVPSQSSADSLIEPRNYAYGSVTDTIPGVIISYVDENKKLWRSVDKDGEVPGDQKRDEFLVTDLSYARDQYHGQTVVGEFSVFLYDENGNRIELKDGKFTSRIGGRIR